MHHPLFNTGVALDALHLLRLQLSMPLRGVGAVFASHTLDQNLTFGRGGEEVLRYSKLPASLRNYNSALNQFKRVVRRFRLYETAACTNPDVGLHGACQASVALPHTCPGARVLACQRAAWLGSQGIYRYEFG